MVDTAFDVLPYCQGIRGDSRLSKPTAFEGCFRILTGDFAAAAGALPLFYRALDVLRSEIVDVDKSRKVLTELIVTRPSNGSPVPGSGQTKINRPNEMVDLLLQGSIGLRGITGIDANLAEIEVIQFQRGKAQTDEKRHGVA